MKGKVKCSLNTIRKRGEKMNMIRPSKALFVGKAGLNNCELVCSSKNVREEDRENLSEVPIDV